MSRIYKPHRTLGLVSNDIPAVLQTRGAEHFVTTCVGRSLNTYNCKKLTLQFVSPLHHENIGCLAGHKDFLFSSVADKVFSWIRGKLVRTYVGHSADVTHLIPFGDHIISFGDDKRMIVHDIETGEVYADMWLQSCVTAVTHPATYLNKVLLGNKDGVMELWNVRTLKLIHQFKPLGSAVTVLTQSPGIDIIGVGLKSGEILLHNLKHDETMMKFYQDWGCVTSLSFRSDGIAHMVSGSTEGHLAVWDLERQELNNTIHHAHHSTVATSHFLASQPFLFTAGADNAIKIWVFDGPGGTARLLRERSGHRAPPTIARFYSATAENILSAGHDRSVRMFSVIKDERSKELSQGSMESKSKKINVRVEELKLSPVTALAAEEIREREWSNVITAHSGSRDVRAWSTLQGALSDKPLSPKLETIVVTAVSITVCGNIAIVGYNSGHLTAFNIQSGINRGLFGKIHAHRGKVVGVASDNINKFVISVGHDTQVKLWDLSARKECHTLSLPHSATHSTLHRDSNLLAVSLDTNTVCVVDIDTRKVVRDFRHSDSVLDMCYSVDGKSLLVCSSDSTIRQWDLITARLIDCFKTHALVTSISLSKENLVTTHHNELGICLWTNRTLYENVELRPLPDDYEPRIVDLLDAEIPTDMEVEDSSSEEWKSTDQINESLITLSTVPKARWTALCKLDIIKKRNKPKAPPTGPKAVPFFLSTTRELVPKFVLEENEAEETEKMKAVRSEESEFQRTITGTKDVGDILKYLDSLSPSILDVELQSLAPLDGGTHELVDRFVDILIDAVKLRGNYDVLQAYINVFLKYNRQYLIDTQSLHDKLACLKTLHSDSWLEMQQKIQECLCVTNFLKSATL